MGHIRGSALLGPQKVTHENGSLFPWGLVPHRPSLHRGPLYGSPMAQAGSRVAGRTPGEVEWAPSHSTALLGGLLLAHPWVVWRPCTSRPGWVTPGWVTPGTPLGGLARSTSKPGWVTLGWVAPGWLARSRLELGWALLGQAGVARLGCAGGGIGPSGLMVPPRGRASGLLSGPIGTNPAHQCGPPPHSTRGACLCAPKPQRCRVGCRVGLASRGASNGRGPCQVWARPRWQGCA